MPARPRAYAAAPPADDVNAVVVDAGHDSFKLGFGGHSMPSVVVPTQVGVLDQRQEWMPGLAACAHGPSSTAAEVSEETSMPGSKPSMLDDFRAGAISCGPVRMFVGDGARKHRPGQSMIKPMHDGLISNWDAWGAILAHGYASLGAEMAEHPLLLSEVPLAPQAQREALVETLFEEGGVPALYLGKTPVLAAFSVGRPTSLVVDFGAEHTRVSAVYDGRLLSRSVQQSVLGGAALTSYTDMVLGSFDHSLPKQYNAQKGLARALAAAGVPSMDLPASGSTFQAHLAGLGAWGKRRTGTPASPSDVSEGVQQGGELQDSYIDAFGTTASYDEAMRLWALEDVKASTTLVNSTPYLASKSLSFPKPPPQVKMVDASTTLTATGSADAAEAAAASGGQAAKAPRGRGTKRTAAGAAVVGESHDVETPTSGSEDQGDESLEESTAYHVPGAAASTSPLALEHEARCVGEVLFEPAPLITYMVVGARLNNSNMVDFGAVPGLASALSPVHQAMARIMLHRKSRFPRSITTLTGTTVFPQPIHRMANTALSACDPELRQALASNVLVTGGGSLVPGLTSRFASELGRMLPQAFKPRVLTPGRLEQRFGVWMGGSVLSSLGTFQQLWISKAEYEEDGAGIVERRCL